LGKVSDAEAQASSCVMLAVKRGASIGQSDLKIELPEHALRRPPKAQLQVLSSAWNLRRLVQLVFG
jgi:hypothetical protein